MDAVARDRRAAVRGGRAPGQRDARVPRRRRDRGVGAPGTVAGVADSSFESGPSLTPFAALTL